MATYNVSTVQQLISTIITANGTSAADTIILAPGVYDLSTYTGTRAGNTNFVTPGMTQDYSGLPVLKGTLTIQGSTTDPNAHVITRSGSEVFRHILIISGATVTLKNLTLKNGRALYNFPFGGAVYNKGTLTISNCVVASNWAEYGAGIRNDNIATVNECQVINNGPGGQGAGLYNEGTNLTVRNTTISGNDGANGGGVMTWKSTANTTIENCIIAGNQGVVGAGAAVYSGFMQVTASLFSGNKSDAAALFSRYDGRMKANNNNIYLNEPNGNPVVSNVNTSYTADVKSNWWGKSGGPAAGEVSGQVDVSLAQATPPAPTIPTLLNAIGQYGVSIYADGLPSTDPGYATFKRAWTASELQEVLIGLQYIARAFATRRFGSQFPLSVGIAYFANVMTNNGSNPFRVLRAENGYQVSSGSSCNGTGSNNKACTDNPNSAMTFYGNVNVSQYTVVHEFGHRFNNQSATAGGTSLYSRMEDASETDNLARPVFGVQGDEWVRGARGWGSGPASTYTDNGDPINVLVTNFQQDSYTVLGAGLLPGDEKRVREIDEATADMFLNWVYALATARDQGFLNKSWLANTPSGCTTAQAGTAAGCADGSNPGDTRYNWMQTEMGEIFDEHPTWG